MVGATRIRNKVDQSKYKSFSLVLNEIEIDEKNS